MNLKLSIFGGGALLIATAVLAQQADNPLSAPATRPGPATKPTQSFIEIVESGENENPPTVPGITLVAKGNGYAIHMVRVRDEPGWHWVGITGSPFAMLTYTDFATGEMRVLDRAMSSSNMLSFALTAPEHALNKNVVATFYTHYLQAVADDRYVYVLERADAIAPVQSSMRVNYHRLATQLVLAAVPMAKGEKTVKVDIKENIKVEEKGALGVPEVVQMELFKEPLLTLKDGVITVVGREKYKFDGKSFAKQ